MTEYHWNDIRVEVDRPSTRGYYVNYRGWDCSCGHCRNFMALARNGQLPAGMLSLLQDLGIPPEKATYVCELYDRDGKLLYQVDYRLAGQIVGAPELDSVPMGWGSLWCGQEVYPCETPGFPEPYFDLGLFVWLPWVLDEPIEGIPLEGESRDEQ